MSSVQDGAIDTIMVTFSDLSWLLYGSYHLPTTGKIQNQLHPIRALDQVSGRFSPLCAWDEARRPRHANKCQEVAVQQPRIRGSWFQNRGDMATTPAIPARRSAGSIEFRSVWLFAFRRTFRASIPKGVPAQRLRGRALGARAPEAAKRRLRPSGKQIFGGRGSDDP